MLVQNVLKAWSELGAKDPEKLKALLVERRLKTFQGLLLQTVLDVVACGGGWRVIQQLQHFRRVRCLLISLQACMWCMSP